MKDNTYIIPAINFYIIKPFTKAETIAAMEKCIDQGKCYYIPFDQVDGLTVEELFQQLNRNSFAFGVANLTNPVKCKSFFTAVYYVDYFLERNLQNKMYLPIDKVIEQIYESKYLEASSREQEIFNNFFERYQDTSHKKTKQRVKRLLEKNKK